MIFFFWKLKLVIRRNFGNILIFFSQKNGKWKRKNIEIIYMENEKKKNLTKKKWLFKKMLHYFFGSWFDYQNVRSWGYVFVVFNNFSDFIDCYHLITVWKIQHLIMAPGHNRDNTDFSYYPYYAPLVIIGKGHNRDDRVQSILC